MFQRDVALVVAVLACVSVQAAHAVAAQLVLFADNYLSELAELAFGVVVVEIAVSALFFNPMAVNNGLDFIAASFFVCWIQFVNKLHGYDCATAWVSSAFVLLKRISVRHSLNSSSVSLARSVFPRRIRRM